MKFLAIMAVITALLLLSAIHENTKKAKNKKVRVKIKNRIKVKEEPILEEWEIDPLDPKEEEAIKAMEAKHFGTTY